MVLTAAFEFDPRSNKEATIRPTDNIEVPQVTTDNSHVLSEGESAITVPKQTLLSAAVDPRAGQHQCEEEGASILLPLQSEGPGPGARSPRAHGRVGGD